MLGTSLSSPFVSRSTGTDFLPRGGSPSHNPRMCFRSLGPLPLGCVGKVGSRVLDELERTDSRGREAGQERVAVVKAGQYQGLN
ncbi:UNVERIFIED_CONTAM: hypothetical protein FKN15_070264 [Acipenser sinensis]